ncbi:type I DNA topoisomerase [Alphaproteobacteria bacterium endosymbiont of Tiliacea citrago]|uniref:type I DNA topoisomerase n=1 Tax=Alphaproteobacteria bacterium endosymbiont of Tiliacea citrago TaxID=3077944 RepID=UPI00313E0AA0
MILIFVESPNKAKAIKEYLKNQKENYKVLATVGHIRNLSKKSGSIKTNENFEYIWEFTPQWNKNKSEILSAAKEADLILIASDPDREGEAIAWHLNQVLKENKIKTPTKRILFHSVSKEAILESINNTMEIRSGLVESYLARVGLDYLFGYSISQLLWRKVPCCKSAGRVQSASLKLIIERENEILNFQKKKYITIHSEFKNSEGIALLTENNGEKFENGNIFEPDKVNLEVLKESVFEISKITTQIQKQNAPAPLITSSLQQLASSQLNFPPKLTMQCAQKLYEGFSINGNHTGLITYMRTDSFNIEKSALDKIRQKIKEKYGNEYLSENIIVHSKQIKNAQEAHEAIRPTNIDLDPEKINFPDVNLKKLYTLIWKRTLASQCKPALSEKTNILIKAENKPQNNLSSFSMTNSIMIFNSFKDIIQNEDEEEEKKNLVNLKKLKENQILDLKEIYEKDHETQPPKRFSEATFISQLEKLGIGRPSTYAKISSVLIERDYVEKQKKIIIPTQKGWIVTAFLSSYFKNEIAYEFTSSMEEKLDELASSNQSFLPTLSTFWENLQNLINNAKDSSPLEVSKLIDKTYSNYFLANQELCVCGKPLMLKVTRYGAMRGCTNYPDCTNTISLIEKKTNSKEAIATTKEGYDVFVKNGPYGMYVQIENEIQKKIPIPKQWLKEAETITQEQALLLCELPKEIGSYNNKPLKVSIGRFGPYVQHEKTFVSIQNLNIKEEEAIKKLEQKLEKTNKKTITKN